jgi:hypothetical protein
MKAPTPEPCCPRCEAIARAHGWTEASGMSVRAYMTAHGLKEDEMNEEEAGANAITKRITEGRKTEPMLRHFRFAHLRSERMRVMSMGFAIAALNITENVPASAERTAALRKLTEAKDCAVRCVIDVEDAEREAAEVKP